MTLRTSHWRSVAVILAFAAVLVAPPVTSAATPAGLVAAYSFDAGSGSVLTDVSGNGNDGTISGARWALAGHSAGALAFDGLNDLVKISDSPSLDLTTGLTLEAWVRPTAPGNWRTVMFKERSGGVVYSLYADESGGHPVAQVEIGSERNATGSASLPLNAWTHLASTYNGRVLRLYVNGVQVASTFVTGAMTDSAGPLEIGGNNVWSEWFQGRIDDLRVYNRALASDEIQADMKTPVSPPQSGDTQAPTAPASPVVSGQTGTALTLSWSSSTDNVGVTGYSTFLGGNPAGTTGPSAGAYTFSGLACGTTYSLGVEAVDAAGNRSARTTANGTTSACSSPSADSTAPSVPSGLSVTGVTQSAVSLSWSASTDNVGVTGYTVYNGSSSVGTASSTSYTVSGLACGTTYSLGVDAVDAAGNHSARATVSGSTAACSAPPPGSANLWIDVNGGSCVRSATPGAYSDAAACSWQQADSACQGGDTVLVKGGNYGDVIIRGSNGRTSACTIRTATGASVSLGTLELGIWQSCSYGVNTTNWITIQGPLTSTEFHADCSNQVTVDGLDMDSRGQQITQPFSVQTDATNFTLRNSKVHDALNPNAMMVLSGSNFTIDNNDIYDDLNNTNGLIHDECLRSQPVQHMRLTRNHLWSCNVMGVFLTGDPGRNLATDWLIENNVFEAPTGSTANSDNAIFLRNGSDAYVVPDGFIVRYNTFGSSGMTVIAGLNTPTANGMQIYGNYFATNSPCGMPNTTYAYNITPTGVDNCGGTGALSFPLATINAGFVNFHPFTGNGGANPEPAGDYHLRSGSPLLNRGNPASYPALDRDGTTRFTGTAPDTGAYENG